MNRSSLQQGYARATYCSIRILFAVVGGLATFPILTESARSNPTRTPDADFAFVGYVSNRNQNVIGVSTGNSNQLSPADRASLRNQSQVLFIAPGNNFANLSMRKDDGTLNGTSNGLYVGVSSTSNGSAYFRFRCRVSGNEPRGTYTVGYSPSRSPIDTRCIYDPPRRHRALVPKNTYISSLDNSSWLGSNASKSLEPRNTYTAQSQDFCFGSCVLSPDRTNSQPEGESVSVLPVPNEATLYQARYSGDDLLVIDVIRGSVAVETPTERIDVIEGNGYTYSFTERQGSNSEFNPDEQAIQRFLDPSLWTSLGSEIEGLEQALGLDSTFTHSLVSSVASNSSEPTVASPPLESIPTLESITLDADSISNIQPVGGTITLSGPAPSDITVNLSSSDSEIAEVPSIITITAGSSSARFSVVTKDFSGSTRQVAITASFGEVQQTTTLTLIVSE